MFENLQTGLRSAVKSLRGKGKLSEANMREGLRLVEESLLEADVSYSGVKEFMGHVSERALGEKVLLSLDPSEQLVKLVYDELVNIMGPVDSSLPVRGGMTKLMLCGLQGSGKTTTCGKLARLLQRQYNVKPLLVAADLQRPAAIDQLHVLGEQLGVAVYSERDHKDPVKVCQNGIKEAEKLGAQVVILDTAGRLAIDAELMEQLKRVDNRVQPDHVYLVVDGMTGQDAVNSAAAFNDALELDGAILTKLDGDARGGALLSVKHVTGVPVKFIGSGERLEDLEPFEPEGMASRILGMGDIVALARKAQDEFDQAEQAKLEEDLQKGQFTLDSFRKQLMQIAKPGLMMKMLKLLPGGGDLEKMMGGGNAEGDVKQLVGIIDSMTAAERRNPTRVIDPSRRNRIARGAGVQASQVNDLVKQFDSMKQMMESMAGKSMRERMKAVQELQQGALTNPSGRLAKQKKGTGKRLTKKDRAKIQQLKRRSKRRR